MVEKYKKPEVKYNDDLEVKTSEELRGKTFIVEEYELFNSVKYGGEMARIVITYDGQKYRWLTGSKTLLKELENAKGKLVKLSQVRGLKNKYYIFDEP